MNCGRGPNGIMEHLHRGFHSRTLLYKSEDWWLAHHLTIVVCMISCGMIGFQQLLSWSFGKLLYTGVYGSFSLSTICLDWQRCMRSGLMPVSWYIGKTRIVLRVVQILNPHRICLSITNNLKDYLVLQPARFLLLLGYLRFSSEHFSSCSKCTPLKIWWQVQWFIFQNINTRPLPAKLPDIPV